MKLSGNRLGPYEIQSAIGAGGMGEVYRARDTRLDRMVAVKVIAGAAAADPSFRERFDREARAISSLDHPHICTLYDVGHEDGVDFLVMQLLDGQTLADRLARGARPSSDACSPSSASSSSTTVSKGPITLEQALRYGAEIASALDAAHKRGIVHRDLKPGNIIVTKSGTKLLDFGLAKLAEHPALAGMGEGATHTVPLTGSGSIVGTLNYMAPEQLEGGIVDTRTDIFAFGAVLFEMLTGRRAFNAQSHAGLIAAILNEQAPTLDATELKTSLPVAAHRALERLIRKCLAKDPDDRWQSAADLAAELRWIDEERQRWAGQPEAGHALPAPASKRRERAWMALALVAVLAGAAGVTWALQRAAPPPEPVVFTIADDSIAPGPGFLAVSPDGRHVAMSMGARGDEGKLAIRPIHSAEIRLLPGTEGAWQPFWSPDSRAIAFTDRRSAMANLKRIDVNGGPVTTLATNVRSRGAWSSAGVILIDQQNSLVSVPERGGTVTQVTTLDRNAGEITHEWPQFLPDGRRFLFLASFTDRSKNAIYLASLDSPQRTRLIKADSSFELSGGYLLYQHEGKVFAQPFDAEKARITGDPQPIVDGVTFNAFNGRASFSAAAAGNVLAYRLGGGVGGQVILQWLDLKGKPLSQIGEPNVVTRFPAVSPDGNRVAVGRVETDGRAQIHVIDVARNVSTRLTSEPFDHVLPVWSPDGAWIYFSAVRKGLPNIYRRGSNGGVADEVVHESDQLMWPMDISSDGKVLLFAQQADRSASRDIWALPLTGERKPVPVVTSKFNEDGARFSPDGRWFAYHSDDMEVRHVYAEPFPPTGFRLRLSTNAGGNPFWSADGRTVYYTGDGHLMAVDVRPGENGLQAAAARELFELPRLQVGARVNPDWRHQRLLAPVIRQEAGAQQVHVVLHWKRALLK